MALWIMNNCLEIVLYIYCHGRHFHLINYISKWIYKINTFQINYILDIYLGLFSYQTWNGMDGFWQNGIAIETMANTMHYGNHSRYFSVVKVGSIMLYNRSLNTLQKYEVFAHVHNDVFFFIFATLHIFTFFINAFICQLM